MKDASNHSSKEQERLRAHLHIHKLFLKEHIPHLIEINQMKSQMTLQKMHALQKELIELCKKEKQLIQSQLTDIRKRMADLPDKWKLENQLKIKVELIKGIIEKITELTEAKQNELNMHYIASRPLDIAVPPLLPEKPYLILYSLFLGGLASFAFFLYQLWKTGQVDSSVDSNG